MEPENIDSIIKKVIEETSDHYLSEATSAKERIWQHVRGPNQNYPIFFHRYFWIASTVILFIVSSLLSISFIENKKTNRMLIGLTQNRQDHDDTEGRLKGAEEPEPETNLTLSDTIYITLTEIVYKPIEVTKVITDTVYIIKESEYTGLNPVADILSSGASQPPVLTEIRHNLKDLKTEILIRNNEDTEDTKERKFRIRFGGNRTVLSDESIFISTKLQ